MNRLLVFHVQFDYRTVSIYSSERNTLNVCVQEAPSAIQLDTHIFSQLWSLCCGLSCYKMQCSWEDNHIHLWFVWADACIQHEILFADVCRTSRLKTDILIPETLLLSSTLLYLFFLLSTSRTFFLTDDYGWCNYFLILFSNFRMTATNVSPLFRKDTSLGKSYRYVQIHFLLIKLLIELLADVGHNSVYYCDLWIYYV